VNQSHSEQLIFALQGNAKGLLEAHFVECWSYYAAGKPLRITLTHEIRPDDEGAYKLKTCISFGIRLAYSENIDVNLPQNTSRSRPFSRGGISVLSSDATA